MSAGHVTPFPEELRRQIADAFEQAHAAGAEQYAQLFERLHDEGKISKRQFARHRIEGALAAWSLEAWRDAGRPEPVPDNLTDGRPPIERVGIEAVDAALPLTTKPAHVFLSALAYLMKESDDALGIADKRAENCDKAAALLKKAAELLEGADNEPLARMIGALVPWAERGKYGRVFPMRWDGHLYVEQDADALSASLKGKAGKPTRAAAIVRALVPFFPDKQEFFTNGGYALIASLAQLCGARTATKQYVRQTIEQARRTTPQPKAPAKTASPDESLLRLLRKP